MPQESEFDTFVRSPSGALEPRRVTSVQEWRIEPEPFADGLVLSVIGEDGRARSFLVGKDDARDLGEVLRRRAGG